MSAYRTLKQALGQRSVASVQTIHAAAPSPAVFVAAAALAVAVWNARAVALSDLALAEWLEATPLGLSAPADDVARLTAAFGAILSSTPDGDDPSMRLDRLANAEPLSAASTAWSVALRGQGVNEWTRLVADDACEVCQALAEGGPFPASLDMLDPHPGCSCVAEPVDAST